MNIWHWILIFLTVTGLAALGFFWGITTIESYQAKQVSGIEPYRAGENNGGQKNPEQNHSRTAVVYFSRSGNTALAARHVANKLNAALYPLEAPQYELGLKGLAQSAWDAKQHRDDSAKLPDIIPSKIDLQPFDTVWLGSPVWFYSPAPPLWAFIENNRFDRQHVVLFNTFNSNFGDDQIAEFKAKVMSRGARSFEHKYVLRGRMTQQLTPEQMLRAIDEEWFEAADDYQ